MPATKTAKTKPARTRPGPTKKPAAARSSRGDKAEHGTMKELDAFLDGLIASADELLADLRRDNRRRGT